jgi:exonuclease SbcC
MIPRRIRLSGFLCYKDEQEVAFDGSSLWMLSGLNGSGKSTIFDAVTYALFGHHRGGATNAGELINKDCKSLSVEFEFLVDEQAFQIRRTLRRDAKGTPKGTQNVYRLDSASGKWVPVPDTNLSDGFKAWVRDKIGLNYETFTSSVLLLQGRAEKLLDSKPSGRAEVLAGIVDLERYQKLHERADTKRKAIKGKLEAIEGQLTGVPDVSDFELLAAENRIYDAEQARAAVAQEVERLQNLEFDARRWSDMQVRLGGLRERWEKAQALIAESTKIEQEYHRLCELRDVIPHVLVIQEKQRAFEESERNSQQFAAIKEQTEARRGEIEHTLEVVRKKRSSHQKTLMKEEQTLETVRDKLGRLAGPLAQLGLYEEQVARLKQLQEELDRLPKDSAELVRRAQEEFDRRVELGKVVAQLERFASARLQLREAVRRHGELEKTEQSTRQAGESARVTHEQWKTKLDAATETRLKADEAVTEARTLLQQARSAWEEFTKLEGAKLCRACGQPLTAKHFAAEKAKRDAERKTAGARHKEATQAQAAALAAETAVRDQFNAADRELQRLREEYRVAKKELELAIKDVERGTEECRHAYLAIAEGYRGRIAAAPPADWLSTKWPTADDQRALKREADDLDTARLRLQEAQQAMSRVERLQAEQRAARATCDKVKAILPSGDPAKLREEEAALRAEEEACAATVRATKKQIQETELETEQQNKLLTEVQKTLANLDSHLSVEAANRSAHRDAIDRAAKLLPERWRDLAMKAGLAEQSRWKAELEALTRQRTEDRYQELTETRASIETLRQEIALAERDGDSIAAEARVPPDEIKGRLIKARTEVSERDEDLHKAREEKAVLDRHRQERDRLRAQILELEKDLSYSTTLAQLLGRDRLQRHLVRTAERQIVDCANGILDRLSGGQLCLRLCGGDDGTVTERALELEALNRAAGESPINVAFLSGSQRFRVAVSLALGIGQYASKQHRPIESVIIDEGFGCLDRNGRQVMIQELQNLRGHLKCILLVSHQEDFADAFADGYRFELANGATRVTRFQK